MNSPLGKRNIKSGDILSVVEAAYEVDEPEEDWLRAIAMAAHPLLDQGFGAVAFVVDLSKRFETISVAGTNPAFSHVDAMRMAASAPLEMNRHFYSGPQGQTVSQRLARLGRPEFLVHLKHSGMEDAFGTSAIDPSMIGIGLTVPLPRVQRVSRAAQSAWSRVAVHLLAGLRLRRRLDAKEQRPSDELLRRSVAVLTPGGRVEHAEGIAQEPSSREALREAARSIDRARGVMRKRDPDAALDLWQGLVSGRWSLVDHFDTDGRRFLVARENEPGGPKLAPLSPRERAVLSLRAQGRSMKIIAYELGLGVSAVGGLLWRARRKLGIEPGTDLAALVATRRDPGE